MLKRLWRYIAALFGAKLDELEDPDVLLSQAQREMTEMHARNRERAVQAITQKNNLQQMVDDMQKRVDNLQAKAELALKRGDRDLALQLLKEKQSYDVSLNTTKESLAQALETVESVKAAIKREEERIRQKTAEALALKAQWKNSQIQNAMHKALDGLQGIDETEQAFGRAQSKIRNANSEVSARAELAKQRVDNRIAQLDAEVGTSAAEQELAELEARLGLGSAPPAATTTTTTTRPTTTATDSDIERQLAELEARVGGSGGSANTGGTGP
jgi:phage shock protein A